MKVTIKNLENRVRNVPISGYRSVTIKPFEEVEVNEQHLANRHLYNKLGAETNGLEVKIEGKVVDPDEFVPPLPPMIDVDEMPISKLTFKNKALTVKVGSTVKLEVTKDPAESGETYSFNIADKSTATLSGDSVKGVKAGTTKVEVRADKTADVFDEATVKVEEVETAPGEPSGE